MLLDKRFTDFLADAPDTLIPGYIVVVSPNGLFLLVDPVSEVFSQLPQSFVQLNDVPQTYAGAGERILRVKNDLSGLEFINPEDLFTSGPGGSTNLSLSFLQLIDTPADYAGASGKILRVAPDEVGLAFAEPQFRTLGDVPTPLAPNTIMVVNPAGDGLATRAEVQSFLQLADTPSTYTGSGGWFPSVTSAENGIEFGPLIESFINLSDTPASYTEAGGYVIKVNPDATGLIFSPEKRTFRDFTDVEDYSGTTGDLVLRVKSDETGMEWVTSTEAAGSATTFLSLVDTPSSYGGSERLFIRTRRDGTGLEFVPLPNLSSDVATSVLELYDENLVVPTVRNLVFRSRELHTSPWLFIDASVPSTRYTSYDGMERAFKITENTLNAPHQFGQNSAPGVVLPNTRYTFSVYLKAGERTRARLTLGGQNASSVSANFDLVDGFVLSSTAGSFPLCESVGNGWFRCSVTATTTEAAISTNQLRPRVILVVGTATRYTGDGISGIFVADPQVEQGEAPTDFIVTGATIPAASTPAYLPLAGGTNTVAIGRNNRSMAPYSAITGGRDNSATGVAGVIVGGLTNRVNSGSVVVGGRANRTDARVVPYTINIPRQANVDLTPWFADGCTLAVSGPTITATATTTTPVFGISFNSEAGRWYRLTALVRRTGTGSALINMGFGGRNAEVAPMLTDQPVNIARRSTGSITTVTFSFGAPALPGDTISVTDLLVESSPESLSLIGGGSENLVTLSRHSMVLGGERNRISGDRFNTIGEESSYSIIGGGLTNHIEISTAYDDRIGSVILGGVRNVVTADGCVTFGGYGNLQTAPRSVLGCASAGSYTYYGPQASGDYSVILGPQGATDRGQFGARPFGNERNHAGARIYAGEVQRTFFLLYNETEIGNANWTKLFLDAGIDYGGRQNQPGGYKNRITLPPQGCAYIIKATVLGRDTSNAVAHSAAYELRAAVRVVNGVASMPSSFTVTPVCECGPGSYAWDARVTVEPTTRIVDIEVRGSTSQNVRWLAKVRTVELMLPAATMGEDAFTLQAIHGLAESGAYLLPENIFGAELATIVPLVEGVYTFESSASNFEVVNNVIKLVDNVSLNFETVPTTNVSIYYETTDGQFGYFSINVAVQDRPEPPTNFTVTDVNTGATSGVFRVQRATPGQIVAYLSASDPDQGDVITFSIRPGGSGALFEIAPGNRLKLRDTSSITGNVSVTLRAEDTTGLFVDRTITVGVIPGT